MPLRLQIFEDRYKAMMHHVLETDSLFGVVLIRRGQEALGPLAEPYEIGCTARVLQTQPLPDGRMNLLAVGQERFHTLSLDRSSQSYLVGQIDYQPLNAQDPQVARRAAGRLRPSLERYLQALAQAGSPSPRQEPLPEEPAMLAYLAAILVQSSPAEKQGYLEAPSTEALLDQMITTYRRELALVGVMLSPGGGRGTGNFSAN